MNEKKFEALYSNMRDEIVKDLSESDINLNDAAIEAGITGEEASDLLTLKGNNGNYLAYRNLDAAVKVLKLTKTGKIKDVEK